MRTEHLEYLLDLQKTLSMTKTAENYFTSHQVINNAIKALEEELNISILIRTHKGVIFSDAGFLVCDFARDFLYRKETLTQQLLPFTESNRSVLTGELDIYTIPRFSNKHFLKLYTAYAKKHAKLTLNLKAFSASMFFKQLPIQKPFVFLTTAHTATLCSEDFLQKLEQNSLKYEIINQQYLGLCVAQKSEYMQLLIENQDSRVFESLPVVVHNYALEQEELITKKQLTNIYLADNFEAQKNLVKSGNYISICTALEYRQFFHSKDQSLVFVPNKSLQNSHFYYIAIYQHDSQENTTIQDFITTLKKYYA